jgi:hypothetical protein
MAMLDYGSNNEYVPFVIPFAAWSCSLLFWISVPLFDRRSLQLVEHLPVAQQTSSKRQQQENRHRRLSHWQTFFWRKLLLNHRRKTEPTHIRFGGNPQLRQVFLHPKKINLEHFNQAQHFALRQHFLGFKQIQVSSPGWILQANPSLHSSDGIWEFGKDILHKFSCKDIDDLAKEEFSKFYDSSDIGLSFPEVHLARRNLKGESPGNISADAFEVQVGSKDVSCPSHFLKSFFLKSAIRKSPQLYLFFPFPSVVMFPKPTFNSLANKMKTWTTIAKYPLLASAGISCKTQFKTSKSMARPSKTFFSNKPAHHQTNDIGKWNISTDKDHYEDLIKWIDVSKSLPLASSPTSQNPAT